MIGFDNFEQVDFRVGTVIEVDAFPKAKKPAYQLTIDFGPLGIKKSSAQITELYIKDDLLQRQIVANVNFDDKQIANFNSQCLVIGGVDKTSVILLEPNKKIPNGSTVQ